MCDPRTFSKLLDPKIELVSSYNLAAVDSVPTIYNLIIDVGQRLGSDDFGIDDRVGAWDLTLAGVLRRGVGEAVERYALRPPLDSDRHLSCISVGVLADMPRITKALRLPLPEKDTQWIRAQRARMENGKTVIDTVLVDSDWVNLPTSKNAQEKHWFGTPSGTASQFGLEAAIDSSLRELIERDAVVRAWNGLSGIELVQSINVRCASSRKLERLQHAFPLYLYRVKSRIGSAWTYIAWNVSSNYVAAGSSLMMCPACAALHASIEALQVGALLREITSRKEVHPKYKTVSTFADLSKQRMSFWASPKGVSAWKAWDTLAKATSVQACHKEVLLTSSDVTATGASHIWVDLTARLPKLVSDEGFRVVKSFVPELLSLSMSEGESWNYVLGGKPLANWEPLL